MNMKTALFFTQVVFLILDTGQDILFSFFSLDSIGDFYLLSSTPLFINDRINKDVQYINETTRILNHFETLEKKLSKENDLLTSLSLIHKNYDDLISFNLNDKKAELVMLKLITIKTIDFYKSLKERYSEDGKDYPEVMKSIELSIEEFRQKGIDNFNKDLFESSLSLEQDQFFSMLGEFLIRKNITD